MPLSAKRLAPKQRLTVCKMNALRQLFRVAGQPQSDRSGGICRGAPSISVYHTRGKRTSSFWDSIELTIRRGGFGRAELPRLYFLRTEPVPLRGMSSAASYFFFARDKSGRTPRDASPGREEGAPHGISLPEQRADMSKGRVNHGFPLTRPAPLGVGDESLSLKYLSIPTRAPAPTGRGYTRV